MEGGELIISLPRAALKLPQDPCACCPLKPSVFQPLTQLWSLALVLNDANFVGMLALPRCLYGCNVSSNQDKLLYE